MKDQRVQRDSDFYGEILFRRGGCNINGVYKKVSSNSYIGIGYLASVTQSHFVF